MDYNLKKLLNFYKTEFCSFTCIIETNYKGIGSLEIVFKESQMPHLLGLNKVGVPDGKRGISLIESEEITYEILKNKDGFNNIKPRIHGFKYIKRMLKDECQGYCVLGKDDKTNNNMKLDVILFDKEERSKIYVLGLRYSKKTHKYYPTTFFQTKSNKYNGFRRTKIKNITWVG